MVGLVAPTSAPVPFKALPSAVKTPVPVAVPPNAPALLYWICPEEPPGEPDPLIVLHPKPVPDVHVRALDAPEQEGTANPEGVVAVKAPRTVLAEIEARLA